MLAIFLISLAHIQLNCFSVCVSRSVSILFSISFYIVFKGVKIRAVEGLHAIDYLAESPLAKKVKNNQIIYHSGSPITCRRFCSTISIYLTRSSSISNMFVVGSGSRRPTSLDTLSTL